MSNEDETCENLELSLVIYFFQQTGIAGFEAVLLLRYLAHYLFL